MFHERHQHALDRHAQLIREAQADHQIRLAQAAAPRRWSLRWQLRPVTLHLPILNLDLHQQR